MMLSIKIKQMTSLTKISLYTEKKREICMDSGLCFMVWRRQCEHSVTDACPRGPTRAGSQHRVSIFSRLQCSWTLSCPPGGLFLVQIALCMEYYIPPRERVAIGFCLEPILSPPPEIVKDARRTSAPWRVSLACRRREEAHSSRGGQRFLSGER